MNIYFTFEGNCEQAMKHYAEALGGELKELKRFKEGDFPDLPKSAEELVLHAHLVFPEGELMASDSMPGSKLTMGNRVALNVEFALDQLERAERAFHQLAADGDVLMELKKTFWGATFGQCIDKYGFRWMINVSHE